MICYTWKAIEHTVNLMLSKELKEGMSFALIHSTRQPLWRVSATLHPDAVQGALHVTWPGETRRFK